MALFTNKIPYSLVVNTTLPNKTTLFGLWIWLHCNSYVIVTSLHKCHVQMTSLHMCHIQVTSLHMCHIQENVSMDADPGEFLTRMKLEVDQHFMLHLFTFVARSSFKSFYINYVLYYQSESVCDETELDLVYNTCVHLIIDPKIVCTNCL